MVRLLPLLFGLFLLSAGCTGPARPDLRPAQVLSAYPDLSARPFPDRVVPLPAVLLEDLRTNDGRPDYQAYPLSDDQRALVSRCYDRLPFPLKTVLDETVAGVSFVADFEGGGLTEDLHGDSRTKYYLVFHAGTLSEPVARWFTFRDNTAFALSGSGYSLVTQASGGTPAFQALLVHEAAHVYDFVHGVTGPGSDFTAGTWERLDLPVPSHDYPARSDLHFYGWENRPPVGPRALEAAFQGLASSGFASFYGSQTWMEDWAELVTIGVLDRDFQTTLEVSLALPDGTQRRFVPTQAALSAWRIAGALTRLR